MNHCCFSKLDAPGGCHCNCVFDNLNTPQFQTTSREISCLKNSVKEHRGNYNECLEVCEKARLGACKDLNGVSIPKDYCNDACSNIDRIGGIKRQVAANMFKQCSSGFEPGKCLPSQLERCMKTNCKNNRVCISDIEGWIHNFCVNNGDWPGKPGSDIGEQHELAINHRGNKIKANNDYVWYFIYFVIFLLFINDLLEPIDPIVTSY